MNVRTLYSDSNPSRIRVIFLFFTFSSFIVMTFGSLYIEMHPENPGIGEFLIGASGPVFWICCGAGILYNLLYIVKDKKRRF